MSNPPKAGFVLPPLSVCVITYLTSPYQVEFFNEISARGGVRLRVIYLKREHDLHPWGRLELKHEHLVLEGHPEVVGEAFRWVLNAALTVCNYYTHWFALAALHLRHRSARPWVFWGERPGFLRLGWFGRLVRRVLLYPISKSAAPIWAIGRAGVAGYKDDWGTGKSYVNLPYFSDLSRFRKEPRADRGNERVILYSGVLNLRKGVIGLAEGFRAAARLHSCLRLIILGAGSLEGRMREILAPVTSQVVWAGFREWHELPAIYAQADALCLPTRHDGWAMVVPEALAAGLPVITTMDAGAALELVRHEVNGWLLPNSEARSIESALCRLAELTREELARISHSARESVQSHTLDEGRSRFVAASNLAMEAFHCRRKDQLEVKAQMLITGTYAPDRLQSMQRYSDLVQAAAVSAFPGVVERVEPPVVLGGANWVPRRLKKHLGFIDKYLFFPLHLRLLAVLYQGGGARTVIHVTDQGLGPLVPWLSGFSVVLTVHDLIAVRAVQGDIAGIPRAGPLRGWFQRFIFWALCFPEALVCVSEKTHSDWNRLAGGGHKVRVVHNPLDPVFELPPDSIESSDLPEAYLLHVGNGLWYKNREGLLRIYATLKKRLGPRGAPVLVMMGAPASMAELQLAADLAVKDCIIWLPQPTTSKIIMAYDRALALIFPSLEEGFGWPVLEAMARGCPVFASNRAPLTEVGGDAVEYIDPLDADLAAEVIADRLLLGEAWRQVKVEQGRRRAQEFSMSRFGKQMAEVYNGLELYA